MAAHCELHFVGSIPLADARTVMQALGTRFGRRLRRIPDGETGPRRLWVQCQTRVFEAHPQLEPVIAEGDWRNRFAPAGERHELQFRPRPGSGAVRFAALGYAEAALASWREFRALKSQGVIPAACRFMVALPSPYNVLSWGVVPEARAGVEPAYEEALLAETAEICATIPHAELSLQWDCAHDMQAFDGARRAWFEPAREGIIARLSRLGDRIPPSVELGYHFCYGSFGGRHFVEPQSMAAMVALANGLFAAIGRSIEWIHMPVPIERSDEDYFRSLGTLRCPAATMIYLGLIHARDGAAGAQARIAAAERHIAVFGIATECGFGRMPAEELPAIFDAHEQVLRACCPSR
jgi:hypothetical protein